MPNWTENHVAVTGDEKTVSDFRRFVSTGTYVPTHHAWQGELEAFEDGFSFQKIVPCPELLYESPSPSRKETEAISSVCQAAYGFGNWYDWCNRHWGTKWDVNPDGLKVTVSEDGEEVFYSFLTAWSAPAPIVEILRKLFPTLEIDWEALNEEDIQWSEDEEGNPVEELPWEEQYERYAI